MEIIIFLVAFAILFFVIIAIVRYYKRCQKYTLGTKQAFYEDILFYQSNLNIEEILDRLSTPNINDVLLYTFKKDKDHKGGELTFYGVQDNQFYSNGLFDIQLIEMCNVSRIKLTFIGNRVAKMGCGIYFSFMNEFMYKKINATPIFR